ncbi:flavin reductase family protein [Amycolatopsis pithecellobii]|uniref:Flavin reductase n=1 Tax=Amycolatopsis pithecellobii TaxID=664692 RepID=A0A6N7Z060_9PSEU|nr:flavin reductase family protein [Amycolatopsis pithecellobii]MTD54059.1 flavin reductase [Amycolatopsis pithecellobii]
MIEIEAVGPDPQRLPGAFGCFPSGVVAVAAMDGGEPAGIAMASFTSVSVTPALVSVCVQRGSRTWPRLRAAARVGLSVLAEGQGEVALRLSYREGDRFAGVEREATPDGSVFVHGAAAFLDYRIHEEIPAGDHLLVLLEIIGLSSTSDEPPLVFHGSRFRALATATIAAA